MKAVIWGLKKLGAYLRGVREEMQKVTWPSRQQAIRYAGLVVVLSAFVAVFFMGLDFIFTIGLNELIRLTS